MMNPPFGGGGPNNTTSSNSSTFPVFSSNHMIINNRNRRHREDEGVAGGSSETALKRSRQSGAEETPYQVMSNPGITQLVLLDPMQGQSSHHALANLGISNFLPHQAGVYIPLSALQGLTDNSGMQLFSTLSSLQHPNIITNANGSVGGAQIIDASALRAALLSSRQQQQQMTSHQPQFLTTAGRLSSSAPSLMGTGVNVSTLPSPSMTLSAVLERNAAFSAQSARTRLAVAPSPATFTLDGTAVGPGTASNLYITTGLGNAATNHTLATLTNLGNNNNNMNNLAMARANSIAAAFRSPLTGTTIPLTTATATTTLPTMIRPDVQESISRGAAQPSPRRDQDNGDATGGRRAASPNRDAAGGSNGGGLTGRPAVALAMECDGEALSGYQCMVREQIELFEAKSEDVESNAQGRNRPIVLGQVGIRCRHCAFLPPKLRARGAIYYPTKLQGLYQAAQNMASGHLCEHCQHVPDETRRCLLKMRERKSSAGGGKKYWADGVGAQGVYEDRDGLRFAPR